MAGDVGQRFWRDDPLNQKLADEYGIVMGTSHHEPMMRAWKEWRQHGKGAWDYSINQEELREFWQEGIVRNDHYESIVTIGMRGNGDEPMVKGGDTALILHCSRKSSRTNARSSAMLRTTMLHCAAGLGALQRSAGILREGHARS